MPCCLDNLELFVVVITALNLANTVLTVEHVKQKVELRVGDLQRAYLQWLDRVDQVDGIYDSVNVTHRESKVLDRFGSLSSGVGFELCLSLTTADLNDLIGSVVSRVALGLGSVGSG